MENWLTRRHQNPVPWLLESNPWTRYKTLIDLLEKPVTDPEVMAAKEKLVNDPQIQSLINECSQWFPQSITRHNASSLSHYQLMTLIDFGFHADDEALQPILSKVTEHRENGFYAIRQTLPRKGEGFPKPDPNANEWHALPCDAPLLTYLLLRAGYHDDLLKSTIENLKSLWETKSGWFCHFFFVENLYQTLQTGCPMAALMALLLFSELPELKESDYARHAFAALEFHRDYGKSVYYFGRSRKFWTFKYPFVWYNALYLADVLTRFEFSRSQPLVRELINWIETSQDPDGRFKPTSIFMNYKNWDFGNKKEASPWMTYLCCRILKRWYQ